MLNSCLLLLLLNILDLCLISKIYLTIVATNTNLIYNINHLFYKRQLSIKKVLLLIKGYWLGPYTAIILPCLFPYGAPLGWICGGPSWGECGGPFWGSSSWSVLMSANMALVGPAALPAGSKTSNVSRSGAWGINRPCNRQQGNRQGNIIPLQGSS